MKKIVFIFLILLLITLLFGCFNKEKTEEETYFYNTPVNDGPRRFAIEDTQPEIFKEHYELNTGLIESGGAYFTKWGSIEPEPPVNGVPRYTTMPNDWGKELLGQIRNSNIEFSTMIEFENNDWAIATDESIQVISPVNGGSHAGIVRIKPQYEQDYKRFIKDYASMMPNLGYLQIDNEPENIWVSGDGYNRVLELTKESIFENDLNIKVLAAGFYIGPGVSSIPENVKLYIKDNFPNLDYEWIKQELNLPQNTNNAKIQKWGQKLHVVMTLLMQENPPLDILTIHLDGSKPYDHIEDVISWYKGMMDEYGYSRPIWIDDLHSSYYPEANPVTKLDIQLTKGLAVGNQEAIDTVNKMGPTYLVRKTVGYFAAGIERVKIVSGVDYPDYFMPVWRYARLFTIDFKPKPTYYTAKLMIEKLDGFITAERIGEDYLYKFTFKNKDDVYVAWSEKEGGETINLENELGNQAKITNIIDSLENIIPITQTINSNNIHRLQLK